MKRICLAGTAIAGLLTIGIPTALASIAHPAVQASVASNKSTRVTCKLSLVTQLPHGSVSLTQGAADGGQYGKAGCGKRLGSGVQSNSFALGSSGTLTGGFHEYFNAGTIVGQYTLTPNTTQPPTTTTFTMASYAGTVKIQGGTGIYKTVTGKGTLKCSTSDAAHYSCTEKLKLLLPSTG